MRIIRPVKDKTRDTPSKKKILRKKNKLRSRRLVLTTNILQGVLVMPTNNSFSHLIASNKML